MSLEFWLYFTAFMVFLWILAEGNKRRSVRKGARKMVDEMKSQYASPHEYRAVNPREFRHLDLGFYDKAKQAFEREGFRHLGDEEDVTIKNSSMDPRTFMRVMSSRDGAVVSVFYQPRVKWFIRLILKMTGAKVGRTTDCESELSDGSVVCTSNAVMAGKMTTPPQISTEYLPFECDPLMVLRRHQERLREYQAFHPGLAVRPLMTMEEVRACQRRQEIMKAAYRESVGWVTREELKNLARGDSVIAEEYHREVTAINQREKSTHDTHS
jgi:hypothetical protein